MSIAIAKIINVTAVTGNWTWAISGMECDRWNANY